MLQNFAQQMCNERFEMHFDNGKYIKLKVQLKMVTFILIPASSCLVEFKQHLFYSTKNFSPIWQPNHFKDYNII